MTTEIVLPIALRSRWTLIVSPASPTLRASVAVAIGRFAVYDPVPLPFRALQQVCRYVLSLIVCFRPDKGAGLLPRIFLPFWVYPIVAGVPTEAGTS